MKNERSAFNALPTSHGTETDEYGVPTTAFGSPPPSHFFAILGRLLAVHGKIEYLEDRLKHLPAEETAGIRKVEQFQARCAAGKSDRNTIVHSYWLFGAHQTTSEIILALRYKTRKHTSGDIATLSMRDVPESDREQDLGQYTLDDLSKLLRASVVTMRIGEHAYGEVMARWAIQ